MAFTTATDMAYTTTMTTKPVVNFTLDSALLRRLDAYRHAHKFPTRSVAIKFLLQWAVRQNPKPSVEELAALNWRKRKGEK